MHRLVAEVESNIKAFQALAAEARLQLQALLPVEA
jgi:hypothetical protein